MIARGLSCRMMGFVVAVVVVGAMSVSAQSVEPGEAELREQLAEIERQIQAEQAALQAIRESQSKSKTEQTELRTKLAEEVLSNRLEYESNQTKIATLTRQVDTLQAESDKLKSARASVVTGTLDVVERLRIILSETPGNDDLIGTLVATADALRRKSPETTEAESVNAMKSTLDVIDKTYHLATSVTVRPTKIHTADGRLESVDLLSIGLVRFAYVVDGRVGIALAGPTDVTGYRWSESIESTTADALAQAIELVKQNRSGVINIPLDATGRIQPQTLAATDRPLIDQLRDGGPVMYPLAGVAVMALLLVFERFWFLYVLNRGGSSIARQTIVATQSGDVAQARASSRSRGGAVGRVLDACLSRSEQGDRAMEDAIQAQLLHELPKLNRCMGGIAILAGIAPLMGLLGTVTGIIETFGVIKAFGNANPSLMAGGISEALITTATGLAIAVPILIVHVWLRGRANRIIADAERHAATLLTILSHDLRERNDGSKSGAQS